MTKKENNVKINKKFRFVLVAVAVLTVAVIIVVCLLPTRNNSTPKVCTTYNGLVKEPQCIEDYIGLTHEEAINRAKKYGLFHQTVMIDGVSSAILDINAKNIFFKVEQGIVVGVCLESYIPSESKCSFDSWKE